MFLYSLTFEAALDPEISNCPPPVQSVTVSFLFLCLCVAVDRPGARGAEAGAQASSDRADSVSSGARVSGQQPPGRSQRTGGTTATGQDRAGGDHCGGRGGDHCPQSETDVAGNVYCV